VIESPSVATTIGSAARIRGLRDQLGHALVLRDDVISLAPLHNFLDIRGDVAGMHGELVGVRPELFVFDVVHRDGLRAIAVSALTDEIELPRLQLEGLRDRVDTLVDFAENGFIEPDALFSGAHCPVLLTMPTGSSAQ
jgi:hypothetical protein